MTFRHPYRLLAVLVGLITVWIVSGMFYASRGWGVLMSIGLGYLTIFPTTVLFIMVDMWLEDDVREHPRA